MEINIQESGSSRIALDAMTFAARLFTDLHDRMQNYAEMLRVVDPVAADHLLRVALAGVGAATDEITDWILSTPGTP